MGNKGRVLAHASYADGRLTLLPVNRHGMVLKRIAAGMRWYNSEARLTGEAAALFMRNRLAAEQRAKLMAGEAIRLYVEPEAFLLDNWRERYEQG